MFTNSKPMDAWSLVTPLIDEALEEFYDAALNNSEMAVFMEGHNISRLKSVQKQHWKHALENGFDAEYHDRVERIGAAHARIGLHPELFCEATGVLLRSINRLAHEKYKFAPKKIAFLMEKISEAVFKDLALGIASYTKILEDEKRLGALEMIEHSGEFSSRMGQLSSEMQSLGSSVVQMNSSIIEIGKSAEQSTNFAREASSQADTAAKSMNSVYEASEEIGSFLNIITEIADKTKLLAVNAAIEAARAGEAGKGFTVVADEVRQLAEGTERGAKDVASKVDEIRNAVTGLRRIIEGVQSSFAQVLTASDVIEKSVAQQRDASSEMSGRMHIVEAAVTDQLSDLSRLVKNMESVLSD